MPDFDNISESQNLLPDRLTEIDFLLLRINLLKPADRAMMETHFANNVSFSQISRLSGIPVSRVSLLIRKMALRLMSDDFVTIIRNKPIFSHLQIEIAYDYYLLALGYRAIADKHRITPRKARDIIKFLNKWLNKQKSIDKKPNNHLYRRQKK